MINFVTGAGDHEIGEMPLEAINREWREETGHLSDNFFGGADNAFTTYPEDRGPLFAFHTFIKVLGADDGDLELFEQICAARSKVEGVPYAARKNYVNEVYMYSCAT